VCHWDSLAAALHIKMSRGCEENAAREIKKSDTRATRVRELGGWVGGFAFCTCERVYFFASRLSFGQIISRHGAAFH